MSRFNDDEWLPMKVPREWYESALERAQVAEELLFRLYVEDDKHAQEDAYDYLHKLGAL